MEENNNYDNLSEEKINVESDGSFDNNINKEVLKMEETGLEVPDFESDETKNIALENNSDDETKLNNEKNEIILEDKINNFENSDENSLTPDKWEELDDKNSVVKKYIVYISKKYVSIMDSMSIEQRATYINEAIQQKIDLIDEEKRKSKKRSAFIHTLIIFLTILLITPFAVKLAEKSILATFKNYKYSQDNFEKLYKQKFEHDKVYMESVRYNEQLEEKLKEKIRKTEKNKI